MPAAAVPRSAGKLLECRLAKSLKKRWKNWLKRLSADHRRTSSPFGHFSLFDVSGAHPSTELPMQGEWLGPRVKGKELDQLSRVKRG
jgi:hypothetical protein